jgi:hypothetical protein
VPSRGDVVPLPFGRTLSAPQREIAPLQEFDRRFHGEREFAQLGFKPPQSRQNVVTWFDAVVLEKRDPICDTGSDQIGDKRVRIHDLRLYRLHYATAVIGAQDNDQLAAARAKRRRQAKGLSRLVHAVRLAIMDRAAILDQSEKLERHIALVEEDLTKQREIIAELLREGYDATAAIALLRQFEDLLVRLFADRDLLRKQLGAAAG